MNITIEAMAGLAVNLAGLILTGSTILYRIKQLEKKVEKHNQVVERVYRLEESVKSAHHRIAELRQDMDKCV